LLDKVKINRLFWKKMYTDSKTRAEMASDLGISMPTICSYIDGKIPPVKVKSVCDYLGVTVEEIMEEEIGTEN
jgi:DNA-binding XRE family transcriptional regulator